MVLSEAQKKDAYREAQHILRLADKWQELMPGERKPNFQRAAQEVLKRALGHKTRRNDVALDVHGGLMHEHNPREARLIERTLRNGTIHPEVLQSFREGARVRSRNPFIQAIVGSRTPVPAGEPYVDPDDLNTDISDLEEMFHVVHYPNEELEFPTHMNTRTGEYVGKHEDHPQLIQLDPLEQPPQDPMRDRVEVPE